LWNAGLEDREFLNARISVCEEGLRRFETDDDLMTENRRRALAESYFELGETGKAEALYREWLKADLRWGWSWIGWSDCYRFRFARPELRDLNRSEQLLLEGLSVSEVRDFKDLAERLADLYEEQGRGEETKELRRQARGSLPAIQSTGEVKSSGSIPRQKATPPSGKRGRRSANCRTLQPFWGRPPRKPPSVDRRSGGTSHARVGAGRSSRSAAVDRLKPWRQLPLLCPW
jgi:hypothetical protein